MLRSNETQRILQETLLDIIVEFLEKICFPRTTMKSDQNQTEEQEKKASAQRMQNINSY